MRYITAVAALAGTALLATGCNNDYGTDDLDDVPGIEYVCEKQPQRMDCTVNFEEFEPNGATPHARVAVERRGRDGYVNVRTDLVVPVTYGYVENGTLVRESTDEVVIAITPGDYTVDKKVLRTDAGLEASNALETARAYLRTPAAEQAVDLAIRAENDGCERTQRPGRDGGIDKCVIEREENTGFRPAGVPEEEESEEEDLSWYEYALPWNWF